MDLRELEYFQMVAKLKNFTSAANKLCISQPSITVAIKKLEKELGLSLFRRNHQMVILTKEGEIFFERVDKILNDVNNTVIEMNDLKELKKEVLRLGIGPMTGSAFIPEIFKKYKKHSTKLEVIVNELDSLEIINQLEEGQLDIGIIALNTSSDFLETEIIKVGELIVCLPPEHTLKDLPSIPFQLLKNESFILGKGGNITKMILEECKKHNFEPNVIFSTKVFDTIKNLIFNNIGIGFLLEPMTRNSPDITFHSLENPLYIQARVAWKKDKFLTKSQREFINFIKSI